MRKNRTKNRCQMTFKDFLLCFKDNLSLSLSLFKEKFKHIKNTFERVKHLFLNLSISFCSRKQQKQVHLYNIITAVEDK